MTQAAFVTSFLAEKHKVSDNAVQSEKMYYPSSVGSIGISENVQDSSLGFYRFYVEKLRSIYILFLIIIVKEILYCKTQVW